MLLFQVPELALDELREALDAARPGGVLKVRHGRGTGALRDGVHALLADWQRQRRPGGGGAQRAGGGGGGAAARGCTWSEEPGSGGAVTVVLLQ